MSDAMIKEVENRFAPKNYIYPFKVYQVIGLTLSSTGRMKVDEINSYRSDLPYSVSSNMWMMILMG
jgi:hypothetical protein